MEVIMSSREFLKVVTQGIEVVDRESGEVVVVHSVDGYLEE